MQSEIATFNKNKLNFSEGAAEKKIHYINPVIIFLLLVLSSPSSGII
jgi:hypothetical protein